MHPQDNNFISTCEGHGWRRRRKEPESQGIAGTSSGEKAYAMPTLSRLYDQRSIYGPSERERRNRFQRVALSELWRHHRPRHCAPSPVGNERSCEIEAALVGSQSHAFLHSGSWRSRRIVALNRLDDSALIFLSNRPHRRGPSSRFTHDRPSTYAEEIRIVEPLGQHAVSFRLVHGVARNARQTCHGRASLA